MKIKILAGIYILILAVIVWLANTRETQYLFKFIRHLPLGDKIGHLLLMGVLSFVVNLALAARTIKIGRIHFLLGSLIVLAVVVIEEFSQIFVRGRTFDTVDLLFDAIGIFAFGELARLIIRRRNKQTN